MKVKELFEEIIPGKIVHRLDGLINGRRFEFDYSKDIMDGAFMCTDELSLTSLKGSPMEVTEFYSIRGCIKLTSLEYAPKKIGTFFNCKKCDRITSLEGIGRDYLLDIGTKILLSESITSNMLGILKIKNLKEIDRGAFSAPDNLENAFAIFNKHLKSGRRVSKCKQELIDNGLKEYAKL